MNTFRKFLLGQSLSNLRKSFRAFGKLGNTKPMMRYHTLLVALIRAPLGLPKNAFWSLLPKDYEGPAQDYLRQMLFHIQGKGSNSAAMMRHSTGDQGPFVFIANDSWRDTAEKDGMPIQRMNSIIRWRLLLIGHWASGMRILFRVALEAVFPSRARTPETPYAVFVDLRRANLPKNKPVVEVSEDLYSWWKRSSLYPGDLKSTWISGSHIDPETVAIDGVKIVRDPLPTLGSPQAYARFFMSALPIISVSLGRILFGHWWGALILRQALLLAYVRQLPNDGFADEYYYNCTNAATRPVWTHYAEKLGSRFTVIEYSHNIRYGYLPGRPDFTLFDPGYSLETWSRHAVLNHDHADELAEARQVCQGDDTYRVEYVEVGPITWRDSGEPLPQFDHPAVAILDSSPHKLSNMALKGLTPRYHSDPELLLNFLDHAFKAARDAGYTPVYKPKVSIDLSGGGGDMGNFYPLAGRFRDLIQKYDCALIHKDTSVKRVIESCDAVIALPFSSSGIIAHLMGKPTVFYDSANVLAGFEKYASGCQLFLREEQLRNWVDALGDAPVAHA